MGGDLVATNAIFCEDDFLPLSALQHLLFCERRAALVHIEGMWAENLFTVEGQHLHERADKPEMESRGDIRVVRGLRLQSIRLGLSGQADVVEFHRMDESLITTSSSHQVKSFGIHLFGTSGYWRPFPVEYKRGKLRSEKGYKIQLCAQAQCLEEMLNVNVSTGAIFFGLPRRRLEIVFDEVLRRETEAAAAHLHQLINTRITPVAHYEKKCEKCSLFDLCLPKTTGGRRSARSYLSRALLDMVSQKE